MLDKYSRLRDAVSNLAAPADDQVKLLDSMFSDLTGGKSGEAYGNDELALNFEDVWICKKTMVADGEVSATQVSLVDQLDARLAYLSGSKNASFWKRNALFDDPRWDEIRLLASEALEALPPE